MREKESERERKRDYYKMFQRITTKANGLKDAASSAVTNGSESSGTLMTILSMLKPHIIGDIGNVLLLVGTLLVTTCMIFQYPSSSYYDESWLKNGFCVSNEDTVWKNSHALSFYSDTLFTLIIFYLYLNKTRFEKTKSKSTTPPLQMAILSGSIMGIFGHGAGHMYLSVEPTGMDLRLFDDYNNYTISKRGIMITLVNFFGFGAIFCGGLPLASMKRLVLASVIATSGVTILNIEPKFNFIYAQAIIFILISLHALSLELKHKLTATYMLVPYLNLPVLVVGILEATCCNSFLKTFGGHVVFDTMISISFIINEILSTYLEQQKPFQLVVKHYTHAEGKGSGILKKVIKRV